MNCPECGQETRRNFCTKCGAHLDAFGQHIRTPDHADEDGRDPNATSAINHRELKEMLARYEADENARHGGPEVDPQQTIPRMVASVSAVLARPRPAPAAHPAALAQPDQGPAEQAPTALTSFGVDLTVASPAQANRLWAIPVIGWCAKLVLLIPHLVALGGLAAIAWVVGFVAWLPVLRGGRYPAWAERWTAGFIRGQARVNAYLFGLVDQYPPFSLGDTPDYPVQVRFSVPTRAKRVWAVPLAGWLGRVVSLIPHLIVLYALWLVVSAMQLGVWAFVLVSGSMPERCRAYLLGTIRYQARLTAYLFGLNDEYPSFDLGK